MRVHIRGDCRGSIDQHFIGTWHPAVGRTNIRIRPSLNPLVRHSLEIVHSRRQFRNLEKIAVRSRQLWLPSCINPGYAKTLLFPAMGCRL